MDDRSIDIGRKMAKGAAWMVLMRFGRRVIGVASTVILARLLLPEDFGVVVLATAYIAIIEVMGSFSLDLALIKNQKAERSHYDTAWTITVLRGVFVGAVAAGLAGPAAAFFDEPRLDIVLYLLAGAALISGFRNIGIVDFLKEFQHGKNFQLWMTSRLISFVFTIALAFWWRNYWALVAGLIVDALALTALSYILHPYRPRFSLREWREIFHFSKWLVLSNVGDFLNTRLDKFVLAKFLDAKTVGLYSVAFETSNLPTTNLVAPMQRAIFPGFARIADDRPRLISNYIDAMSLVLIMAVPLGIGIWLTADYLVRVMLGLNWIEAVPLLQILAIYGVLRVAYANTRPIYLAVGRPNLVAITTGVQLAVLAPCLFYGVWQGGVVGAAWAMVGATAITASYNLVLVARILGFPVWTMPRAVWRTLVATAVMIVAVEMVRAYLPHAESLAHMTFGAALINLCAVTGVGALVFVLAHLGLWMLSGRPAGAEAHIIDIAFERLQRLKSDRAGGT